MNRHMPWALALALLIGSGVDALASEKRPLPEFSVTTLEGAVVPVASLGMQGQWLIVYVGPDSAPSGRLLQAMKAWEASATIAQRSLVVVGGEADSARQLIAKLADDAPAVRWVTDPTQAAWKALRLSGTPTIVGVRDGRVEWALAGVLNNPATLESVVTSWVGGR